MTTDEVVETRLECVEPIAAQVPVGAELRIRFGIVVPSPEAPVGGTVSILDGDGELAGGTLARTEDGCDCEISVRAPEELGAHEWRAVFPEQSVSGTVFGGTAVPLIFETVPQPTSLAVWDLPAPAVTGERIRIKAGAKSAARYPLGGTAVEVLDESGAVIGGGAFGDTPLAGSDALYWTELDLPGPASEGIQRWSVRVAATEPDLPHRGSALNFSFVAAKPAEHRLAVDLVDRDLQTPVAGATLRIGPYRTRTDAAGTAVVTVTGGEHKVIVWHAKYRTERRTIGVAGDTALAVEMHPLPPPREPEWM